MSISPAVHRARHFQDLLAIPGGVGPYRFTSIFRESDRRERRLSRWKFRLLKRIDGEVRETARSGERVFFFTTADGLSFWERWVLGWRRALVLTDRRMVLLQLDARSRPRTLRCQLRLDAVERIGVGRRGRLRIGVRSGGELVLRGVPAGDRDFVLDVLRKVAAKAKEGGPAAGLEDLCPHCREPVRGRPRRCPRCLGRFRRPWLAALLSLVVPGAGNRTLGYRGLAWLEFLGAAAIWAAWLLEPELGEMRIPADLVRPEWIFLAVHGTDALWTWYAGRRGIHPGKRA